MVSSSSDPKSLLSACSRGLSLKSAPPGCSIVDLADLLKATRSMTTFSRDTTLVMHLEQTCGEKWSLWLTGTPSRAVILDAQPLFRDFLVKRLVIFVLGTLLQHNLHTKILVAIALSCKLACCSCTRFIISLWCGTWNWHCHH